MNPIKLKFWSISTTIRNPERIRNFLKVLKELEGEVWDYNTQVKFQIKLIQNKLYGFGEPQFENNLSKKHKNWLLTENLSYQKAKDIFFSKNYKDPPMRGRVSFSPIEKLGFVYLNQKKQIVVSDFGNKFLESDYDLGEIFLKSLLKWQYPSPGFTKYKKEYGYDIKPFIASLHLINEVNKKCKELKIKEKGVSKKEFAMFFVSLINFKYIKETACKLVNFRLENEKLNNAESEKFFNLFFKKNFNNFESWNNAVEYTDNIIRYFRLTRFIIIRGNGFYIDLEPRRIIEIKSLLKKFDGRAECFDSSHSFRKYLGDFSLPELPWENVLKLKQLQKLLFDETSKKYSNLLTKGCLIPVIPKIDEKLSTVNELKKSVNKLRIFLRVLNETEIKVNSQSVSKVEEYIDELSNIFQKQNRSIELEKYVNLALNALNDAITIKPNYPVGDDNEPTFTAPANKADIECFYQSFYSICEVTLLTNRSQWYNEGQPVMRHIRDFENKYFDKETYCLFVAPKLHRDTVNTFWISVKYEYEGKKQKIIPVTIYQFIEILKILKIFKERKIFFTHNNLKKLYDSILNPIEKISNSDEWIKKIPNLIKQWGKDVFENEK